MIAFEFTGQAARAAPESVALKNGPANVLPSPGFDKAGVLATHSAADR